MRSGSGVRLVVGVDGQPEAIQIDIQMWRKMAAALEDAEDVRVALQALAQLDAAGGDPARAGWLRLEEIEKAWTADDGL